VSYELSNRGNYVAVVSDSTRVLGDGDCTPSGGLGVMEGKAFLMKYLGGGLMLPRYVLTATMRKGNLIRTKLLSSSRWFSRVLGP
jgi:malic enzyme